MKLFLFLIFIINQYFPVLTPGKGEIPVQKTGSLASGGMNSPGISNAMIIHKDSPKGVSGNIGEPDSLLISINEISGFKNAVSIAKDNKENIYLLDKEANEIIKFDGDLNLVKRNGRQGWNNGQFDSPTFIDASSGLDLYVCDPRNYRIQRFDLDLIFIASLRTDNKSFHESLQFKTPLSSVVINANDLYVVDGDNNRIVIFPNGAEPVSTFGDYRSGRGELIQPEKIMKDGNNYIYILDKKYRQVYRYDNLGNFVKRISIPSLETFTIFENRLYLFDGKDIFQYDLDRNTFTGKKTLLQSGRGKNFTDFLVLSSEKYLLLEKNSLSLWKGQN
jgi:hypothetical protein